MILEKAVAKFCGTYGALAGGSANWGFMVLTGCTNQIMLQKSDESTWTKKNIDFDAMLADGCSLRNPRFANDEKPFRRFPTCDEEQMETEQFWQELKSADDANYVMGCAFAKEDDDGSGEVEQAQESGLVAGHLYSLLKCAEVDGMRFMQARNPWGMKEWTGAWSDQSELWEQNPGIAEALKFEGPKNDGIFWMSFNDFAANINKVNISASSLGTNRCKSWFQW